VVGEEIALSRDASTIHIRKLDAKIVAARSTAQLNYPATSGSAYVCGVGELLEPLRTEVKKEYERRLCDQCQYEGLIDLKVIDEIISAGVRSLARTHHPDAGGDHDKMVAINNAADWLRERARN